MTLSDRARSIGQKIDSANGADLRQELNAGIAEFVGWPFVVSSGRLQDANGRTTATFPCIVHSTAENGKRPDDVITADSAAVVVDVIEDMDLEQFRGAYERIAEAKRLQKSPAPRIKGAAVATLTLTLIFARRTSVSLEALAEELQRLNESRPSEEWPDMVAVSNVGVVSFACQIPGHPKLGDIFPPAERGLKILPPWYVVVTIRPTSDRTFNKMLAFIVGYATIFSPGAKVPNFTLLLEGVSPNIITLTGYQYNLAGELKPVPRQQYADRYIPALPMRIEDNRGQLLSTVEFIPWQDGGVVLMRGKLPLEGVLVFLGNKKALSKAGVLKPAPGLQLSYVLPINHANFMEMLARLSRQSNMIVRPTKPSFTIQKMADEGTSTPFVARMYVGLMHLRDVIYGDPKERLGFDKVLGETYSALTAARTAAKEIREMWETHARKVESGQIARLQGDNIHVEEDLSGELRRRFESFVYSGARALKEGMKNLGRKMGKEIGFMFQKPGSYERGILALQASDPALAAYLQETRTAWSERLINIRNAIDHGGWSLPRVEYKQCNGRVEAKQPLVEGQPTVEVVELMLDRLSCFAEEFTAHCLQSRMPEGVTLTEIPLPARLAECPERFRLTLRLGGSAEWNIGYHTSTFDNT
jgi:hypothetical protein